MKKLALMVLLGLVLSACGGSDFVGLNVVPEQDAASETSDAGQPDALQEDQKEATTDAADADAAKPEAGEDVDAALPDSDAAEPDADAAVQEASPDAEDEPEASIEAGEEKLPDVCVPTSCQAQGKNCGSISDGCGGTLPSCGTCPSNQTCGGGGVSNVCGGCVADTCAAHGYNCGSMPDGCGNTLSCGPAFHPFDYGQCDTLPPHGWICGSQPDANKSGPPPYADCVKAWHNTSTFAYCCPEES